MAWKLRQPFEGDRIVSASGVGGGCWLSGSTYVTNTIAINIAGVEYILPSIISYDTGFLFVQVPTGVYINATDPVQVYAVCEDLPASKSNTLNAKSVDFQVTNGAVISCNPQVILNSDINEWVRIFMVPASGSFFNLKVNNVNTNISSFGYQVGDSGNITSTSGNWSRPTTDSEAASLISSSIYAGDVALTITPASLNYFTIRLGYLELIFSGGNLLYNNYLQSSEVEIAAGTYVVNDVYTIEATNSSYVAKKNGTTILTKSKAISYLVSGGTVTPSTSTIGTPVAWNIPGSTGNYTFTATVGDSLKFQKTVRLHSCATAVNDSYVGTYNTPFTSNVSTNDSICTGENNYIVTSNIVGGTLSIDDTGAFTFTPTANYNGVASFNYTRKCGTSSGNAEVIATATVTINYFNACNGVVANWQPNAQVRCNNCTEEKQEYDVNGQCTGNTTRWVSNTGGSACTSVPNLVPTSLKRCQSCVNQQEVQDLNACSSTYLAKSWIADPTGVACDVDPLWVDNGQFRCQDCIEQKQQRDTKTCSPTYDSTRWIANPIGTQCNRTSNWTDTDEFICLNCVEYKVQRDLNACSPVFNSSRNVVNPTGVVCNTNPSWIDTGLTRCTNGVHEKEQTSTNSCSVSTTRWIETGLELCGCVSQVKFTDVCLDDEIIGVVVNKQSTIESNRLISYANGVITFRTDIGTFDYVITLTRQSGIGAKMLLPNYRCTPIV